MKALSAKGAAISDKLEAAIDEAFSDTGVPAEETLEIMLTALSQIEEGIRVIREDIGAEP